MKTHLLAAVALAILVSAVFLGVARTDDKSDKKILPESDYAYDWKGEQRKTRQAVIDLGGGEKLELVRIAKGSFQMGTTPDEVKALTELFKLKDAFADESPQHQVTITHDFYLGKTHVTVGQFRRFATAANYTSEAEAGDGAYGSDEKGDQAKHKEYNWKNPGFPQTDRDPVVCVTWTDAKKFMDWLQSAYGVAATFPTEAQFEYANRGGTTTRYFTGDDSDSLEGYANVSDASLKKKNPNWQWLTARFDDGYPFTSPVASFKPNPFGLYDMTGNAEEWCRDWYDSKYYANSPAQDPVQSTEQKDHVVRGASFSDDTGLCRPAYRNRDAPGVACNNRGFRVCVPVD